MRDVKLKPFQPQESESLAAMGDLLEASEVNAWTAIPSFARFCIDQRGSFIAKSLLDLYAANISSVDLRKQYLERKWPTETDHTEICKGQYEFAHLAWRAIKSSAFITVVATCMGLFAAQQLGRLSPSLPFRIDIALQATGAVIMAFSGILTFYKLPSTWGGEPLMHRVYQSIYTATFATGLPIALLGQLLAQ
jgi:hypothetical protein